MSPSYKTFILSSSAGVVFTLGLIVSQMVDPNKVVAFLSIFHNWDPSLALVIMAAILVAMPAFMIAKRKSTEHQPAFDGSYIKLPSNKAITPQLLLGSICFGIGWGMLGFCPAPALVSAFAGYWQAMLFIVAMLVGFGLHGLYTLTTKNNT